MDGAPVRGESIPVRLFLGAFDLTPTYKNICNKYSVKYLLNLVLVDEEDRRYFKQTDITLWRKQDNMDPHKLITVKDAQEVLTEGKKERRKKRREKKKENQNEETNDTEKKEKEEKEEKDEKDTSEEDEKDDGTNNKKEY